jgi:hypothetical protein
VKEGFVGLWRGVVVVIEEGEGMLDEGRIEGSGRESSACSKPSSSSAKRSSSSEVIASSERLW